MTVAFERVIPVFRIFSIEKAREFYLDFLGFKVVWEARFGPDLPLYMQVSQDGFAIHLSEHHGDATPGSKVFVTLTGVPDLYRELTEKKYRYNRPGLEEQEWGMTELTVNDSFGNRITFGEPKVKPAE
jgi:catechol 2,3-dioxygenase-like lactoylglutathione lyase family enzyme